MHVVKKTCRTLESSYAIGCLVPTEYIILLPSAEV